jgi:hypothetical protein
VRSAISSSMQHPTSPCLHPTRGGYPHERHLIGRVDVGPRRDQPVHRLQVAVLRRDEEGGGAALPGEEAGGSQPGRGPQGPPRARQGSGTVGRGVR